MRYVLLLFVLFRCLPLSASALEILAPEVPGAGNAMMPENTASFSGGLRELLMKALRALQPELTEAVEAVGAVIAMVLVFSLLRSISGGTGKALRIAGAACVTTALLGSADSLIRLGLETVTELSEYGKLLLPVMTAAMAAQGGPTGSAALYAGTAVFDLVLTGLISKVLVPGIYFFLALSAGSAALGEDILGKLRDSVKWAVTWTLKTLLTVFTAYMSITGVVSGTTDAAALKAAKFTISNAVPVVGGILSDASEAVLVSTGLMKNAAGIYGLLAVLAVFLAPFLKIGAHYAVLKLASALCALFGDKSLTELIGDFSTAMGLVLAMTGSVCLLQLISTVCFLKGAA